MKLVIESAYVREVTIVVAGVELPLTREQVVLALFGPNYEIVPIGSRAPETRAKRSYAKRAPMEEGRVRERGPNGFLETAVAQVLGETGESSLQDIRAAILRKTPEMFDGKPNAYLAGALRRFVESGVIRRIGTRGSFVYSLANAEPSWGTKPMSEIIIEVLSKRSVPVSGVELKGLVEKKYPGVFEGCSPSLLSTTLSNMKRITGLVKATKVDGAFTYALVKDWEKVLARRNESVAASRAEAGQRLAKAYKKRLREGKTKGKSAAKTKPKPAAKLKSQPKEQLEMKHLNGAAPARAHAAAEAVS